LVIKSHKAIFKVDYKPKLDFYEKLTSIASGLEEYPDWRTDRLSVTLQNLDSQCSLNLAYNSFWYVREKKEDSTEGDAKRIRAALEKVVPTLENEKFLRLGLRRIYLYAVEMKFEELVSVIDAKLFSQNEVIKGGICPLPTDVAYVVDFIDDKLKVKLKVGPVRRGELELQLQPDRNSNFPVKMRGLPGEELYADYPSISLLIDIDVSKADPRSADLPSIYENAEVVHAKLSQNVVKYVFGLKE
jgi:hypothetical protein